MGLEEMRRNPSRPMGVAPGKEYWGKYVGLVRDTNDPDQRGRIRCFCPEIMGNNDLEEYWLWWALPCFPVAGGMDTGAFLPPPNEVIRDGSSVTGEERLKTPEDFDSKQVAVWIEFRQGDPRTPIYSGFFYFSPEDVPSYIPKLAQGVGDETFLPPVGASKVRNKTINDNGTVSDSTESAEPPPEYGTIYPNNRVFKSPSGHVVEFDDTPSEERIRCYHRSGAYLEMNSAGSLVTKVVGQHLTFVDEDVIEAFSSSARRVVTAGYHEQAGGDVSRIQLGQSKHLHQGNANFWFKQNWITDVSGAWETTAGDISLTSGNNVNLTGAGGLSSAAQKINSLGLIENNINCPTGVTVTGTLPATSQMMLGTEFSAADLAFDSALQADLGTVQGAETALLAVLNVFPQPLASIQSALLAYFTATTLSRITLTTALSAKQTAQAAPLVLSTHRLSRL